MRQFDKEMLALMCYWMAERERIRVKKEKGEPRPWTDDQILQQHRFCNTKRMDDKVSQWLLENWYDNKQKPRTLLIAASLARMINWPDSLAIITGGKKFTLDHWDYRRIRDALLKYEDDGRTKHKVFTGAYIINGAGGGSKIVQVLDNVRNIADCQTPIINKTSMEHTHRNLLRFYGVGSFIAGQIVADLRWTSAMQEPTDAMTWAPLGPGSRRGMNRLTRQPLAAALSQAQFNELMPALMAQLTKMKRLDNLMERLEAMDIQNCLCEFDKYTRLKNKEGQVRSKYPGVAESGKLEGV